MQTNPEASLIDRLHGSPRTITRLMSARLSGMAKRLVGDAAAEVETWCIFDNTAAFAATGDALTTKRLVKTVAESGNAE